VFSRKTSSSAIPAQDRAPAVNNPSQPSDEEAQRQAQQALRQSVAFAQIVSLLMQSPLYRHFGIADLEWLVIPPLATGMFALAEMKAQANGPSVPAAVVLWASVSPEVDARLSGNLSAPIRLRPDEWRSGELVWVVAVAGDPRVVSNVLRQLSNSTFEGRSVKIRVGDNGKVDVKSLDEIFASQENKAAIP